jgi:hypothetical protein
VAIVDLLFYLKIAPISNLARSHVAFWHEVAAQAVGNIAGIDAIVLAARHDLRPFDRETSAANINSVITNYNITANQITANQPLPGRSGLGADCSL